MFKKYTCIKQHDEKDCGIACLSIISRQYGYKVPMSIIREYACTDKQGTSVYGIIEAAKRLGFTAKAVKTLTLNNIFGEFSKPAIAHVIMDGSMLNYVVIHKVTKNEILIADHCKGIVKYKPEDFFKIWSGVLILMVPAPSFQKGDETKGLFQRFWGLIKVQKSLLANIFIASIIITVFGIIGSFYYQFLIDDILPNTLNNNLLRTAR